MIKSNLDISIVWMIAIAGIVMTLQTFCSLSYLHYIVFGFYYSLFLFKMRVPPTCLKYRMLIKLLSFWTFLILIIGFFSQSKLFDILFYPYLFLPYSFIFLANKEYTFDIQQILKIIFICNIIYILIGTYYLFYVFNSVDYISRVSFIEYSGKTMVYSALFGIMLFKLNTFTQKIVSVITIILGLYFALILGRRSMLFVILLSILFSFYYNCVLTSKSKFLKCLLVVVLFFSVLVIIYIIENSNAVIFEMLKGRMDRDSRSGIVDEFYEDFACFDYVFGRGIGGTFETPYTSLGESGGVLTSYRNGIETGYLDLILKGGICYLFLMVLTCFIAIYRALFKNGSYVQKGAAFFILVFLCELIPNGTFLFTLRFYLLWYAIFLCLKDRCYPFYRCS